MDIDYELYKLGKKEYIKYTLLWYRHKYFCMKRNIPFDVPMSSHKKFITERALVSETYRDIVKSSSAFIKNPIVDGGATKSNSHD